MISTHLCECGCGQFTKLAPRTDRAKGWVKGEPLRFVLRHRIYHLVEFPEIPPDTPLDDRARLLQNRRARKSYRKHHEANKAKNRTRVDKKRAWKLANPDRIRASYKRRYAARKHIFAKRRAEFRKQHHAEVISYYAAYRKANKEKLSAYHYKRQAKLLSAGHHTAEEWIAMLAFYGHKCVRCGRSAPEVTITKDHVIPVTLGGSNDITNLQPLCKSCNSSKRQRSTDYRPSLPPFVQYLVEHQRTSQDQQRS